MAVPTDDVVRRKAKVLTAFMQPQDATQFASGGMVLDPPKFVQACQAQHAQLPSPLPPAFTPPQVAALTPAAAARVAAVKRDPLFAKFYSNPAMTFEMVELAKLIACQWWVDIDVSTGVHGAGAGAQLTDAEVAEKCLPVPVVPRVQTMNMGHGPNGIVIYSMNNTLGVFGPKLDPATGQVTFAVGAGANLMMVRENAGRYVLANGYHRARMLLSRGVTMAPVVLQRVQTQAEVIPGPGFIPEPVIFSPRPPTLEDFADPALALDVDIRATLVAVKITAEVSLVPRLLV